MTTDVQPTMIGPYKVHPFADLFPLIEGDEFTELVESIKRNGLREPIILSHDGEVLIDGRNRYRACLEATADPVFETLGAHYTEDKIVELILDNNVRRRHFTVGQRSMIALKFELFFAEQAKERQRAGGGDKVSAKARAVPLDSGEAVSRARESAVKAAKKVGVGADSLRKAKKVKDLTPDLAAQVSAGQLSLDAAFSKAKGVERDAREAVPPKPRTDDKITLRTHDEVAVLYPAPKGKLKFNETKGDGISWAHWSWNPVTGCLRGCAYCYARSIATDERMQAVYPVGFKPLFHHERLECPANTEVPDGDDPALKRVFVCSMSDLYGGWIPSEWIEQVHESCVHNPQWQYIHLTKNPSRYLKYPPPPGSWAGASVDEQKMVRIAEDAARSLDKAAVKWLSIEPLRERLRFNDLSMFDWVVIGAQTETYQPNERGGRDVFPAFAPPFEWVSSIVDQAREAGCAIHMKPNLLGRVDPRNPGMTLLDEFPDQAKRLRHKRA